MPGRIWARLFDYQRTGAHSGSGGRSLCAGAGAGDWFTAQLMAAAQLVATARPLTPRVCQAHPVALTRLLLACCRCQVAVGAAHTARGRHHWR